MQRFSQLTLIPNLCVCVCSFTELYPTLCDPMHCSMPGFPALHYLLELLKFMSIDSVMLSNHFILCCPFLLRPSTIPSIRVFSNESALHIRWPKYWIFSFSISLSMNIQGWFPLGLTDLISLLSRDSHESSPIPQFESINSSVISFLYGSTLTSIHDYWKNQSFD